MRLVGVVKSTAMLSSKLGMGGSTAGWIIEEFTAQMRAVSKVALHRRSNLAAFLETNGNLTYVILSCSGNCHVISCTFFVLILLLFEKPINFHHI